VNCSSVIGDPQFTVNTTTNGTSDGTTSYWLSGQAGQTYNVVSDHGFQLNAQMRTDTGDYVGVVGATVGTHQVQFDRSGQLRLDGTVMGNGTYQLGNGSSVTKNGNEVRIVTPEYQVTMQSNSWVVNINNITSPNTNADGILPAGLLGSAMDGTQGDHATQAQVSQYQVSGLFDTTFANNNRFAA
jgi:hypothetical protein